MSTVYEQQETRSPILNKIPKYKSSLYTTASLRIRWCQLPRKEKKNARALSDKKVLLESDNKVYTIIRS